jgi:hypothetical protein
MRGTAAGLRGRRLRYSGEGHRQSARCGLHKQGGLGWSRSPAQTCPSPSRLNAWRIAGRSAARRGLATVRSRPINHSRRKLAPARQEGPGRGGERKTGVVVAGGVRRWARANARLLGGLIGRAFQSKLRLIFFKLPPKRGAAQKWDLRGADDRQVPCGLCARR